MSARAPHGSLAVASLLAAAAWWPGAALASLPPGRPNLQVGYFELPAGAYPGQQFSFRAALLNTGMASVGGQIEFTVYLSRDTVPGNAGDVLLSRGFSPITPVLQPDQGLHYRWPGVVIPPDTAPGRWYILVGADTSPAPSGVIAETNERDNWGGQAIDIQPANIAVTDISAPQASSGQWLPVDVTVANTGPAETTTLVRTCVCGNCDNGVTVTLPPFSSRVVHTLVMAPPSQGDCGQPDPCAITACVSPPAIDSNPADNCRTQTISIIDPHFDLRLTLENVPSAVSRCGQTTWRIRVVNAGDAASPAGVRIISGLNCRAAFGDWSCNTGQNWKSLPSLAPGAAYTYTVGTYSIPCNAYTGTQYIKAEVCMNCTPTDLCTAGNGAAASVSVR